MPPAATDQADELTEVWGSRSVTSEEALAMAGYQPRHLGPESMNELHFVVLNLEPGSIPAPRPVAEPSVATPEPPGLAVGAVFDRIDNIGEPPTPEPDVDRDPEPERQQPKGYEPPAHSETRGLAIHGWRGRH